MALDSGRIEERRDQAYGLVSMIIESKEAGGACNCQSVLPPFSYGYTSIGKPAHHQKC